MDAPALPPSQSTVPALIANASASENQAFSGPELDSEAMSNSETPPNLQAAPAMLYGAKRSEETALPTDTLSEGALLGIQALDFRFLSPNETTARSLGWLPSTALASSFEFVSRAFRSAQLDRVLQFSRLSAAVPIQWARSNNWKSWASTADIKVTPVDTKTQIVDSEQATWAASFVAQCLISDQRKLTAASYRLSLKEKTLGYVADRDQAYLIAQQLEQLIRQADFEADKIVPQHLHSEFSSNEPSAFKVAADDRSLFSISEPMAEAVGYSKEWAAVAWANNLRIALEAEPLKAGEVQMALKGMEASNITLKGDASWYGPYFHGRLTANGETYNQHDLTVAHKSLPFGTHLKVRNLQNDRTVVLRVNDRGPYVGDRSLDLSNAAAKCLGSDEAGVIPYEAVILNEAEQN